MADAPFTDERERRLIEAVVSLAKSFREDRERLAKRLAALEDEIDALSVRLDLQQRSRPGTGLPSDPPPDPNRTPS